MKSPFWIERGTYFLHVLVIGLIGCLVTSSVYSAVPNLANSKYQFFDAWVGRYPSEPAGNDKSSFLASPTLRQIVPKLVSNSTWKKMLTEFAIERPIWVADGYYVMQRCFPHNCPARHFMFVMNPSTGAAAIGTYERIGERRSVSWFSIDIDYDDLPASIQEGFSLMHSP